VTLKEWDTIIQQIMNESNQELKEAEKRRLLMKWRAKLEKEPPHLALHQIDEIVREVRRRLETSNG
jgi:IS5 family transposase